MKKIERAFRNWHRELDEDYQKLCDTLNNVRMSHNRKCRLLNKCDHLLGKLYQNFEIDLEGKAYIKEMRDQINRELCCCGRVNWRTK